jgi:thioredoxin-related protein
VINDPDGALAAAWGVRGVPTFFVVDSQGMIRFREVGYTTGLGLRWRLWLVG